MIKRERKLNKILAIAAAILLAVFSVFAVLAPQIDEQRAGISASAEEGTEATSEETSEEETIYPTDNLLSFPYSSSYITKNGITFSQVETYKVHASGINTNSTGTVFDFVYGKTFKAGTYTIKFYTDGNVTTDLYYRVRKDSYYGTSIGTDLMIQKTFTLSEDSVLFIGFGFVGVGTSFYTGEELDVTVYCQLNLGEVAYPYRPCNKSFYDKGYTEGESAGYTQGKEEGYTEGYNAASDDLELGVLKGATVSADLTYWNNNTGTKVSLSVPAFTPTFTYNGIDMGPFVRKYYYYNNDEDIQLESAQIYINFAVPFVYEQFPISFFGSSDSDVYGGYFVGTDGKQYACERDVTANYSPFKIDPDNYSSNLQVSQLVVNFGRASDTLDGCFICESGGWQNGFSAGYNEGYEEGYHPGFTDGKKRGYDLGYADALAVADNSGFANLLYAVVDTPVKAFSSLLDFDILGVNMKNFVLSVLTLAFFISVLRWIIGRA